MDNERAFAFVIGLGILLMFVGFAVGAAVEGVSETAPAGLLFMGAAVAVGGVILWLVVEQPVTDPYKEPAPDYGHHDDH
jgi:hypothetical protein